MGVMREQEPAILQHFELTQYSLDFLQSLGTITKPRVEISLLPEIGFKGIFFSGLTGQYYICLVNVPFVWSILHLSDQCSICLVNLTFVW